MTAPALDLAIVTSCSGYGRWLGEWADSIVASRRAPAMVGLVDSGLPGDVAAVADARARLESAGIRVTTQSLPGETNLGVLRNAAVALSDTTWVQHLDCDDMLMPHGLDDVAALMPEADVVGLGYERCGDLAAGPRNKTRVYRSHQGPATLADPTPCSGVSPFRRSFWERSPYPTDQVGGWDTALWLGFGHLGARFVATKRPCFWYRQHADSVFNVRRKALQGWGAILTGQQLQSRRRGDRGVSVLVPLADENGPQRAAAWTALRTWYARHHPTWQLLEGRVPAVPWCKGGAVAQALTGATGRILVIADADCVVAPAALEEAVRLVETGVAPWVVPHTQVYRLSERASAAWLATPPTDGHLTVPAPRDLDRPAYQGFAGGGIFVVSRPAYLAAGGIPRIFVGWGGEDEAIATVLDTLLGHHRRLAADLLHFWHPPQVERQRPVYRRNRYLFQRLETAARQGADVLWQTLTSLHPGLGTPAAATVWRRPAPIVPSSSGSPPVPDHFARRRLALAQQRLVQQEVPVMAGARDLALAHRRTRLAQQQRNLEALQAAEEQRRRAFGLAGTKQGPGPSSDKMDRGAGVSDKAFAGSGVTLEGVPFASVAAQHLAAEARLDRAAFSGRTPSSAHGFTTADVRSLAA